MMLKLIVCVCGCDTGCWNPSSGISLRKTWTLYSSILLAGKEERWPGCLFESIE